MVVTRTEGERVIVRLEDGRELTIVAVRIDRGQVQIGVGAPASVIIFREELREKFSRPKEAK